MHSFRVLRITNNIEGYPDCERDTLEFPQLVKYVQDEMDIFILNLETLMWFHAKEFFYMAELESFYTRTGVPWVLSGKRL